MDNALAPIIRRLGGMVLPDNDQWKNRFQIHSETSDRLYTVAQRKSDDTWGCDCFGWKRYRKCKHLQTIVPLLGQANPAAPRKIGRG